jgi:heavy metal sensor kinase
VSALARIPIRLRLTLGFAVSMAIVLAALGLFLYTRVDSELDQTLNTGLRSRAQDVAALVRRADSGLGRSVSTGLIEPGESYAQVLTPAGDVLDSTPPLGRRPLLDGARLERAASGPILLDRGPVAGSDDPSRILALPVDREGERLIVVVGTSLEPHDEALASLRTQLLIGGPLALLLASLAGYGLATAALRPVESMRSRAAQISGEEPGQRLPVVDADDEIRRLGETLNAMLGRIDSTIQRERRFVADASHELRTPLASLRAELELAVRRERTRAELVAALLSAGEEAERLSQLAEDLLVLARADEGRLPVQLADVDVARLLGDTAARFGGRAATAGRELAVLPAAGTLAGDRLRLEQALGNLVDNALRHGAGAVTLRADRDATRVELHVLDEGAGFEPAFLPRAFERFARADESRSNGGSGLGLSIVDVIARAHNGSAHAANARDGGADVWLELPAGTGA